MNSEQWDNICSRCGRCCYEKIDFDGAVYYTATPCNHLDLETNLCRVYGVRHQVKPECMPLTPETIARGILPADCPYVADIEGYPAPELYRDVS